MAEARKSNFKHEVDVLNAALILKWMKTRGGIFIWESINMSDPGKTTTTPATTPEGKPMTKPRWDHANEPKMHITDMAEVGVITAKEIKRFHVGVRVGSQGMSMKVTDAGTARIHREVDKAREKYDGAWYEFDYSDEKNVVIMATDKIVSLPEWEAEQARPLPMTPTAEAKGNAKP